jgi:Flp pilus assembly protein TadD
LFGWFNARDAAAAGTALADQFPVPQAPGPVRRGKQEAQHRSSGHALGEFFQRAARESRTLRLNFYRRATLANSFKWRLLENGVDAGTAEEVTRSLVLHISLKPAETTAIESPAAQSAPVGDSGGAVSNPRGNGKAKKLLALGDETYARGDFEEAVACFQQFLRLKPGRAAVYNTLGIALRNLGRYAEAQDQFRKAIGKQPDNAEAHGSLGALQLSRGQLSEAEGSLRRAIKLKPDNLDQRSSLGLALVFLGRLADARAQFDKVLKVAPRHADALYGKGLIANMEGRFDEAVTLFKRTLDANPQMPRAWAALAGVRKMTPADNDWLARAEQIATGILAPLDEAGIRFAIGKYFDDVCDFERAFNNYKRANELLKTGAERYQPDVRTRFVDDLVRVYTPEAVARVGSGAAASIKPVFVVGMMRSGTSLAEQIIASHPAVVGAGELSFWNDTVRAHHGQLRQEMPGEPLSKQLADRYLGTLASHSQDALRVIDKAPINSDYLGIIHSVFPKARIIYMRRDPIDTCLSCYFQPFSATLNFTMDLADLAHYYREHQRLMAHWRRVLPPGAILEVPYAGLVSDQEGWTRKMIDFLGLEWDPRCLDFTATQRPVATASFWQVRQGIYKDSVQRWRNYKKYIAPLLELKD